MVIVNPINTRFGLLIESGEDKVFFEFSQLTFRQKSIITSMTTKLQNGEVTFNASLECFFTLKYALKDIKGFTLPNGEEYKLRFESGTDCLTDECVEELLATPIEDKLLYSATQILNGIPTTICNPVTGEEIEGVEVIPPVGLDEAKKKFSNQ